MTEKPTKPPASAASGATGGRTDGRTDGTATPAAASAGAPDATPAATADPEARPSALRRERQSRYAERFEELGLPPHRILDEPKALRALAHPTRVALMEALGLQDTLTATQASELVGESPTNCAFHLRTLAKYGFVTQAEGGRGRERPWRVASSGLGWRSEDADPATALAGHAAMRVFIERWFERIRGYEANERFYPPEIRTATTQSSVVWFATPDEMHAILDEITELMARHVERYDPGRRPAGTIPFEGLFFVHPLVDPPALGRDEHDDDEHDGDKHDDAGAGKTRE